jgi:hypothetical protein
MAKVSAGLWKHTDRQKVIEIDERTCVDLDQHGPCAVTQHRVSILKSVGLYRPRRQGPQQGAVIGTDRSPTGSRALSVEQLVKFSRCRSGRPRRNVGS